MPFWADSVALQLQGSVLSKWEAANYLRNNGVHRGGFDELQKISADTTGCGDPLHSDLLSESGRCLQILQTTHPTKFHHEAGVGTGSDNIQWCVEAANPRIKYLEGNLKRKKTVKLCSRKGFTGGSAGKESACNVGDLGLIPGLGRSPGEAKGYPL